MKKIIITLLLIVPGVTFADNDDGCKVYLCLSKAGAGGSDCTERISLLEAELYVGGARLPICAGHDGEMIMNETDGLKSSDLTSPIHLEAECCADTYCAFQRYTLDSPRGTFTKECP